MGSGLVVGTIVVILFIIVVASVAALATLRLSRSRVGDRYVDSGSEPALVFRPIPGQDPAAVVLALHAADVEAVSVLDDGDALVLIPLAQPGSEDDVRRRARTAIAHGAALNLEGDEPGIVNEVRFVDEPPA